MTDEAAEHEEEDKRRKEEIEERNKADSFCYQAEKTLNENREKVSAEVAAEVEAGLSKLKDALKAGEVSAIKTASEELAKATNKMAVELYNPKTPPQQDTATTSAEGQVVDAEFEDIKKS